MSTQKRKRKLKLGQLIGLVYEKIGRQHAPGLLTFLFRFGFVRRTD